MDKPTAHEYYSDLADMAKELREQERDRSDFELSDAIHEYVDGSQWVIYTYRARLVLEFSDNDCAIFDEMGSQEWSDWSTAFSQSAYFAMVRDLYEAFENAEKLEEEDDEEF